MKLTKIQIDELYEFTQKHFVEWYDVQTELVDHLANGIEAYLEQNPNATFESALNYEFKKFGIMGFSEVIEQKTKALNSHSRKLVWTYFKDFFKLPKIILTLFLIWVYYVLLSSVNNNYWIVIPTFIVLFGLPLYFLIKETKSIKAIKKTTNKKWLFNSTIMQLGGIIHFMNIGVYLQIIYPLEQDWSTTMNLIFSICAVLFGLALYIAVFVVTPLLRKEMARQHPEYKFT